MTLAVIACLIIGADAKYGNLAQFVDMHNADFEQTEAKTLFHIHPHDGEHVHETAAGMTEGELSGGSVLDKDASTAGTAFLETEPEDYIKITLPQEEGDDITLWLYRTTIYNDGAVVCLHDDEGDDCEAADQGRHYWGIVEGRPDDSVAACSLQETEYSCLVQLGDDQFVLGNMADSDQEVFYNTKDLNSNPNVGYDTVLNPTGLATSGLEDNTKVDDPCVAIYVEVEYDIYEYHNSDEQETREWVEAAFAEVFALYANDGIRATINHMKIWTTPDDYPSGSWEKLDKFTNDLDGDFPGDIAHLVSYEGGGGIAYVGVICSAWGTAYSGLSTSFSKAPTFSWTVEVIAHEMGHNLGSPHTHSCSWGPNGNEAIDCCGADAGYNECSGSCNAASDPVDGGTIMSYCHLTATGINFNHGFGPYPVQRMKDNINNASCLTTCDKGDGGEGDGDGEEECITYFRDADGDQRGDPNSSEESCDGTVPDGYVSNNDDCDDTDATLYPGAECLDGNGCKGSVGDDCVCYSTTQSETWYEDADGDGYGNPDVSQTTCNPPEGWVNNSWDCNDQDAEIYSWAMCKTEEDCWGYIDDENCTCVSYTEPSTVYEDNDRDGYGNSEKSKSTCDPQEGWVSNGDDCDDNDANSFPGSYCQDEYNCWGYTEKDCSCAAYETDRTTWYADADLDGYGDPANTYYGCYDWSNTTTWVDNDQDCDDNNNVVWIGAYCGESGGCGAINQDCKCESGAGASDTYYADVDGDGYGDPSNTITSCDGMAPAGYVTNDLDCDDEYWGYYQGADCWTGTDCDTFIDPSCYCATQDPDRDGICNGIDICPGQDDKIDEDGNGIPDCVENCASEDAFDVKFLRVNSNNRWATTTKWLNEPARAVKFIVYNFGRKVDSWEEIAYIWYTTGDSTADGTYEEHYFGSMTFEELKVINAGMSNKDRNDWRVLITDEGITSITVGLENTYSESTKVCRVNLGDINYCADESGDSYVLLEKSDQLHANKDL